jgi:hypothetical protein
MNNRCKAWTRQRDEVLRCEGIDGHLSVHFNGDHWWPNKPKPSPLLVGALITVGGILALLGFLMVFVWRWS